MTTRKYIKSFKIYENTVFRLRVLDDDVRLLHHFSSVSGHNCVSSTMIAYYLLLLSLPCVESSTLRPLAHRNVVSRHAQLTTYTQTHSYKRKRNVIRYSAHFYQLLAGRHSLSSNAQLDCDRRHGNVLFDSARYKWFDKTKNHPVYLYHGRTDTTQTALPTPKSAFGLYIIRHLLQSLSSVVFGTLTSYRCGLDTNAAYANLAHRSAGVYVRVILFVSCHKSDSSISASHQLWRWLYFLLSFTLPLRIIMIVCVGFWPCRVRTVKQIGPEAPWKPTTTATRMTEAKIKCRRRRRAAGGNRKTIYSFGFCLARVCRSVLRMCTFRINRS